MTRTAAGEYLRISPGQAAASSSQQDQKQHEPLTGHAVLLLDGVLLLHCFVLCRFEEDGCCDLRQWIISSNSRDGIDLPFPWHDYP